MMLQYNRFLRIKVKDDIISCISWLKSILLERFLCPYLKMALCF